MSALFGFNKLVKENDIWVERPITPLDLINPTVKLATSGGEVTRIAVYLVIARLFA